MVDLVTIKFEKKGKMKGEYKSCEECRKEERTM